MSELHAACRRNDCDEVRRLLANGKGDVAAMDNSRGQLALHICADNGNVAIVKLLLAAGSPVDARDAGMLDTPLHRAANSGHLSVVEALLAAGASPAATDRFGNTPLHEAVRQGRADIVVALLTAGAPLEFRAAEQQLTALHVAAASHQFGIAATLADWGADTEARTANGTTVVGCVIGRQNKDELAAVLAAHRARREAVALASVALRVGARPDAPVPPNVAVGVLARLR